MIKLNEYWKSFSFKEKIIVIIVGMILLLSILLVHEIATDKSIIVKPICKLTEHFVWINSTSFEINTSCVNADVLLAGQITQNETRFKPKN